MTKSQLKKQVRIEEDIQRTKEWLEREEEKNRIEEGAKKIAKIKNVDQGEDELCDECIPLRINMPKGYKSPVEKKITRVKKDKQIDTKLMKYAFIDTPREETVKLEKFAFMDEPVITSYPQHKFKQLFGEDFVEDTIRDI